MEIIAGTTDFYLEKDTAAAIGKFDGVHLGHRRLLEEILNKKKNGLAACVFTFDPTPAVLFGLSDGKELTTREEKRRLFERLGIDILIEFPLTKETAATEPERFVTEILAKQMNTRFVAAGEDLSFGKNGAGNAELLEKMAPQLGFCVRTIEKIEVDGIEVSSTYIRKLVEEGRMEEAEKMLGGGNVAMDAARCAKRLGAENVYIVYRRGMAELPARKEEVEHAEEEGIIFKTLTNPTEVLGDENGWVKGMTCVEMELGEPDASGRRRPIVKEGSEFVLNVDTMIMALGTSPNPLIRSTTPGLDADKHGCLITNGPDGLTSRPMVYAGGDAVTGAATVILAMGAGKEAARAIDAAIKAKEQ